MATRAGVHGRGRDALAAFALAFALRARGGAAAAGVRPRTREGPACARASRTFLGCTQFTALPTAALAGAPPPPSRGNWLEFESVRNPLRSCFDQASGSSSALPLRRLLCARGDGVVAAFSSENSSCVRTLSGGKAASAMTAGSSRAHAESACSWSPLRACSRCMLDCVRVNSALASACTKSSNAVTKSCRS